MLYFCSLEFKVMDSGLVSILISYITDTILSKNHLQNIYKLREQRIY